MGDLETAAVIGVLFIIPVAVAVTALYFWSQSSTISYQNVEVIEWTDWRGRSRKITIHRRAEV